MASLLLLNFGTYAETHRFKALGRDRGFLDTDALDAASPGDLVQSDGVQKRNDLGAELYSFYGLSAKVWRSKLSDDTFKAAFEKWMIEALKSPVHCIYIAGHHWTGALHTSWGEESSYFYAEFDTDKQQLLFGVSSDQIMLDTTTLRSECRLIVGFGCNVATAIHSQQYQSFFDSRPVVLAWDQSIRIPKRSEPSVNERFFDFLETRATTDTRVPKTDRLVWFYDNDSMQLVRAWGRATKNWFSGQARARDKDGNFYKFKKDKKTGEMEPVKA
ncbi:MAG: hypothetical protein ACREEP_20245 [Dongiaceae bacterium]